MNIIIIDKKEVNITTTTKQLVVDKQKIPFHLIDVVLIETKTILYSSDIIRLSQNNIPILLLNSQKYLSSIIISSKGKNAELKLKQYQKSLTPLPIAKYILSQKATAHIEHLKKYNITLNKSRYLAKISNANSLDELLGIEGSLSKIYFEHYFKLFKRNLHNNKRTKQPPKDPLNAVMSWQYTLFYNLITIKLILAGFEPLIGYLHRPFREHNALSSDILEVVRADINEFIYQLFKNSYLKIDDFTKRGEGVYLKYESRKNIYTLFQEFQAQIEPKITNTITAVRSMLWKK